MPKNAQIMIAHLFYKIYTSMSMNNNDLIEGQMSFDEITDTLPESKELDT